MSQNRKSKQVEPVNKTQKEAESNSTNKNQVGGVITSLEPEKKYWKTIFWVLSFLMLVALIVLSSYAGISGDEEKHHAHAIKVYNWYKTLGKDTSALSDPKLKLNYYGQSFDLLCYGVVKALGTSKIYETRHIINAIVGLLTILCTGLWVRDLTKSYLAGSIAQILMFITPSFLGHSTNNPLDIPFALGYAFTLMYLFKFLNQLPKFSTKYAIFITLGIGFTTSIRIGGLLLIAYSGLFAGLFVLFNRWPFAFFSKEYLKMVRNGILYLFLIAVWAYLISLIFWPFGLVSPINNPMEALKTMSNIDVSLKVMYEGLIVWSNALPWYYISKNILITVPVLILTGFVLTLILWPLIAKKIKGIWLFFLLFTVVFPIVYVIIKQSNVYGSWRHLTFIYPSMIAMSSIGIWYLFTQAKNKWISYFLILIFIGGTYHPVRHIIINYKVVYVYFNEIVGGVNGIKGKYETDYYFHSLKHGSEWLLENELSKITPEPGKKLRIASNGNIFYYFRNDTARSKAIYLRYYDRGEHDWDYAVFFCNYLSPFQIKKDIWPPKGTIHTIKVDDAIVCAVVKRLDKSDYLGFLEKNNGNFLVAEEYFKKALAIDPRNETAIEYLGEIYLQSGRLDECISLMQRCNREVYPDYERILEFMGIAYLGKNEPDNAAACFNRAIKANYKYVSAYYWLARTYLSQNATDLAINYLQKALEVNSNYGPVYELIGQILQAQGKTEEAKEYFRVAAQLR